MNIQLAINRLIAGADLSRSDMRSVMSAIMTGETTSAQIAGFLVALRIKGESVDEITAAAEVMRELSTKVDIHADHVVDIVGTGGDGAKLFNVSTASAFVAAAAGCHVAKHGNRSVSSSSGSADLLEAAGVDLSLDSQAVARCVQEVGVGFMFAVNHHSAMKHAIGPRKELGTRTIFNMLGPMTNPAAVTRQILGVYDVDLLKPIANAMHNLGSEHLLVVHSHDGLDEISVAAPTEVCELKQGEISLYTIEPEQFSLPRSSLDLLTVNDSAESLSLINMAFSKSENNEKADGAKNMIALNAGAAIYAAGRADSLIEGVSLATDVIASGTPAEKIRELTEMSQLLGEQ